MHTKDILADALRDAGLPIMAARASYLRKLVTA